MKVYIIIQARMGSSRLPGKVLMPIGDKPALRHVIDRTRRCAADNVIVATSSASQDDILRSYCAENYIPCFRGSENDVLERYYEAALYAGASSGDYIVRVTGDCPLLDPDICNGVISLAKTPGTDYASNALEETYPDGLNCEAFTFETLCRMHKYAAFKFEREHVTQHAIRNPDKFNLRNLRASEDYSKERWTLDKPADYEFLCKVYSGVGKEFCGMPDVLEYLKKHPELRDINNKTIRNEGLLKSLREEGLV